MKIPLEWDSDAGTLKPAPGSTFPPVTSPGPGPGPGGGGGGTSGPLVRVVGAGVVDETGRPWVGHGVNICDVRGDNSALGLSYDVSAKEIMRRLDYAKACGVDFIRYLLESYTAQQELTADAKYLAAMTTVVKYALGLGMKVEVGLWIDPNLSPPIGGQATTAEIPILQLLVQAFKDNADVLIGLCNEPRNNNSDALKKAYTDAVTTCVLAIRRTEMELAGKTHVVVVQGVDSWARNVSWFVNNPIPDSQVLYACHVYDPASAWPAEWQSTAKLLPVYIEEYGPASMSQADCLALQTFCHQNHMPSAAWCWHMATPPNMLVDNRSSNGGTQVGMPLALTPWGQAFVDNLKILKGV